MKKLIVVLGLVSLCLFTSCKTTENPGPYPDYFSHSYVTALYTADTFLCGFIPSSMSLHLDVGGRQFSGQENAAFQSLCQQIGDWSYDRTILAEIDSYSIDEFAAIDLVSDRDFDQTHPAGTSLGDVVLFYGASAWPFIESGYDLSMINPVRKALLREFLDNFYYQGRFGDMPIKKLLKDLTADDLRLLLQSFNLKFEVPPPAGKHNFTITFRSAQKVLSQTIEVEVEKP